MSELEEPQPNISDLRDEIIELQNVMKANWITSQRIYDVLLLLLGHENQEAAQGVIEGHRKFENIGPMPFKESDED